MPLFMLGAGLGDYSFRHATLLSSLARVLHAGICSPNTPCRRTPWAALHLGRPRSLLLLGPPGATQHPCVTSSASPNSGQEMCSQGWESGLLKGGFHCSPFVELQSSCRPGGGELCSAEVAWAVQRGCAALPSSRCSGGLGAVLIPPQTFTHPLRTLHPLPLPCSCWRWLCWLMLPKLWCSFSMLSFGEEALHGLVWGAQVVQ